VDRGITPIGRHRQRERFARAVEVAPDDGKPPNRRPGQPSLDDIDPELADELAVVALLRRASTQVGPDAAARERMRERALAGSAPVLVRPEPIRSGARGRLVVALAAALCLVLSLTGMSLLLSRDALPGDALYGMKRSAESASLGFTFGDQSKALKRLEFATARISEMETLADRYRGSGGGAADSYLAALADFDSDAAAGSRELATIGANSDGQALSTLAAWAQGQAARLGALRPHLPTRAADRSATSLDLLGKIEHRADDLHTRISCFPITSGSTDEVGPLPAEERCDKTTVDPNSSAGRPPSSQTGTSTGSQPAPPPQNTGTPPGPAQPAPSVATTSVVPAPTSSVPTPAAPSQQGGKLSLSVPVPLPIPLPISQIPPLLPGIRVGS
jgi:hypothetical protein